MKDKNLKIHQPHPEDKLLRRKEAARKLTVTPHTLAVWAWRGFGPPVIKVGRLACYWNSDIEAFLNMRRTEFPSC